MALTLIFPDDLGARLQPSTLVEVRPPLAIARKDLEVATVMTAKCLLLNMPAQSP
jgi:hypothetical protein